MCVYIYHTVQLNLEEIGSEYKLIQFDSALATTNISVSTAV